MSTIETGQPPLFAREVPPVAITEVPYEQEVGRSVLEILSIMGLVVLLTAGCGFAIAFARTFVPPILFPIAMFLCIFTSVLLYRRYRRRSSERVKLPDTPDVSAAIAAALPRIRGMGAHAGLKRVAQQLVERGRTDSTIRIGRGKDAGPVQPLAFQFEPQPLNEAVCDLIVASAAGGREIDADALARVSDAADAGRLGRTVSRNVILKGGWVLVSVFGFQFVIYGIQAIIERRVTIQVVCWALALAAVLFLPARRNWLQSIEFLVVPGGLIRRKARWRQEGWNLHVYDRRRSVLIVSRQRKQRWGACVSDGAESDSFIGTKREIEFLLRAWTSPLEPPPVERLSDLA